MKYLDDADYVGDSALYFFQRFAEHEYSAIGEHFHEAHLLKVYIVRTSQNKVDCLLFEALYIKKLKPTSEYPDRPNKYDFVQLVTFLFVFVFVCFNYFLLLLNKTLQLLTLFTALVQL